MKISQSLMIVALLAPGMLIAQPQKQSLTTPTTQTIPQDYIASMNRQEERLDQIDARMVTMETSLKDFKDDTKDSLQNINSKLDDMSATNIVMKFVLGITALLIPTIVGVWLAEHLKRRRSRA